MEKEMNTSKDKVIGKRPIGIPSSGPGLIAEVLGDFQKTVEKLKIGMKQCDEKKAKNMEVITKKEAENQSFDTAKAQAETVISGIEKMLNGG